MARLARPRAWVIALLVGLVIGSIVVVLTFATSPPPGIQWPPAAQVENMGTTFTPRTVAGGGVSALPSDCTRMLVDVDSNVPVTAWVTPHDTPIDFNRTAAPPSSYYWTGVIPVEHLGVVVKITDPSAGFSLTVFDPSYHQSGSATFGSAFSASDCP